MPILVKRVLSFFRRSPLSGQRHATAARDRVHAKYDAAQTTDENVRHWANSDSLGPNAALDPAVRQKLRDRSRYETANDSFLNGIAKTLANDTIGTGPALQLTDENKIAAKEVETKFWEWCLAVGLPQKLRTMRRAKFVDGEAFGSLITNPRLPTAVKLDLRLHEAEMIASPNNKVGHFSATDGIVLDDYGNVVGYSVLKVHPGEYLWPQAYSPGEADFVSANKMIHLFNQDRPGQCRGVPESAPALSQIPMRRRYSLAVLRAAENAAINSGVIETQESPDDPMELVPLDPIDIERGSFPVMPAGWRMTQIKAEQPTATYDSYQKSLIRSEARSASMPLNIATGDSSGYNYASGRMDHQVYFKSIGIEQSAIESMALDVLFREWWHEARLIPDYLPAFYRGQLTPPGHNWRWDGREHVDPYKEASAQSVRLANGTTHRRAEYAREGRDIDEEDAIAARDLGLPVKQYRRMLLAKLMGTSETDSTTSPLNDREDDDEE